ncbi:hypothetical protein BH10ACT6_BH10ACT6_13840 [soil metagenome]
MRKTLAVSVLVVLLVAGFAPAASARTSTTAAIARLSSGVSATFASLPPGDMTTVIVTLRKQADLKRVTGANRAARLRGTIQELTTTATAAQVPIRSLLRARATQGKVARATPLWVVNGISVTATADVIQELAARPDIASITPDRVTVIPAVGTPEPGLSAVSAPAMWDLGFTGQGVVVASLDSGVDVSHPDLAGRWRGGADSWFDPYGEHPVTPTDLSGHGTATTGAILGGDAGGTAIGVAPGATWIAAKIFNDRGAATVTAIHQAFQWVLDPDHDPNTADAPQIVNGSWSIGSGPGCDLQFQSDLQALRAVGILPVFAAGNYGSGGSSSVSPANYPEALSVGAVSSTDLISSSSSRGPSTCGARTRIFPDVVAPGVNIRTADLYGLYQTASGTSMSAPNASGALALLLGAVPGLTTEQAQDALTSTAVDLGVGGPDTAYGNGRINVMAAYQSILGRQDFGVAVTPADASSAAGGSVTYTVQITRNYGFNGPISLSLSGLSVGQATWAFSPASVPAGSSTAQLMVSTASTIPLGSYPLTLTAVSGRTSRTATASLAATPPTVADVTGPATQSPSLAPNPTNATTGVSLKATGDDSATGGSGIAAAEYFIDTAGADGTGTAMTVAVAPFGSAPMAALDATISSATVNALGDGSHVVLVHARDAAANWGGMASAELVVDKVNPVVSEVAVSPSPTSGAVSVTLTGKGTDATTAVTAAEWFSGTDPGAGKGMPMLLSGPGPWAASSSINVGSWGEGAYPLMMRVRDAAGNWSVTSSVVLQVRGPLSFSTFGNSLPAGVNGTADDADVYGWNGTVFSRVVDASAAPYGLPSSANVDGFDRVDATHFYVSFSGRVNVPGIGNVDDEDVVFFNGTSWSFFFDGSAHGLTGTRATDLDAISIVGGELFFSTDNTAVPPGVAGGGDDADIYRWSGGSSYTRVIDASVAPFGLPAAANVDGFVRVDADHFYLSFSADTTVPGLGAVQDEDVISYNMGVWSVYFDGTAHGLTGANLDIDAFDVP